MGLTTSVRTSSKLAHQPQQTTTGRVQASHPGPQRKVRRRLKLLDLLLYFGIVVSAMLLLLQACVACLQFFGQSTLRVGGADLLKFPLPDSRSTVTIVVGFVSLLFVRDHFSLGLRPVLSYHCFNSTENKRGLAVAPATSKIAVATLENNGGGIAMIRDAKYRLSFEENYLGPYRDFIDVKTQLDSNGLGFNKEYWLVYFSSGWTMTKEKIVPIFEMIFPEVERLFCLDIKLTFEGIMGDRYEKEIYCIPRPKKGAPFVERL